MSAEPRHRVSEVAPRWARRAVLAALPALMATPAAQARPADTAAPRPAVTAVSLKTGRGKRIGGALTLPAGEAPCPMLLAPTASDAPWERLAEIGLGVLRLDAPTVAEGPASPPDPSLALAWLAAHERAGPCGLGLDAPAKATEGGPERFVLVAELSERKPLVSVPEELVAAMAAVLSGDELNARFHTLVAVLQPLVAEDAGPTRRRETPVYRIDLARLDTRLAARIPVEVSSPA